MDKTVSREAMEAGRLLNEPLLAAAFEAVRIEAMVSLCEVNPDDKTEILRLQAVANCLQDVRDRLKAKIIAAGGSDGGISAEVSRPNNQRW